MKTVWVANAFTESCEHYTFVFDYEPTEEQIKKEIWNFESGAEDEFDFYLDTTSVYIDEFPIHTRQGEPTPQIGSF